MTKVPARPSNVVPPRPAVAAPKPGNAAIPAAAKAPVAAAPAKPAAQTAPTSTQDKTVVAPNNPNTNPIAGISTTQDGAPAQLQAAVNQPASTVDSGAVETTSAGTNEGAQVGVDSALTGGVQSELAATGAEAAATPNPGKRRGRKPGSGKGGGGAPKKATFPGLLSFNEDGSPVMVDDGAGGQYHQRLILGEVPVGYDPGKHEKLKPSDFQDESVYCDFMQNRFASLAKLWERKAKKIRAMGTATDKTKALKFLKMREEMAKLAEQLRADGMDVDSLDAEDAEEAAAAE